MNLRDVPFNILPTGLKGFLDDVKLGLEELYRPKPYFLAVPSADSATLAKDTYHTIEFQTVRRNVGGHYSKETHKFKASVDGDYHFDVAVGARDVPIDADSVTVRLRAGSYDYETTIHPEDHPNANNSDIMQPFGISVTTPLLAGQYAYVDIYQNGGSTPYTVIKANKSHFSGYLK